MNLDSVKNVNSITDSKGVTYKIGDVIHIVRHYFEPGHPKFHSMENSVTVNVKVAITKIMVDESGFNAIFCGKFSTSTDDYANKGHVPKKIVSL